MTSVEQGWKALQSGNFSQSAEIFNSIIQRDPSSVPALIGLTRTYIITGNLDKAQSTAELAANRGRNAETEALLGEVTGIRGDRTSAERHLLAATKMEPTVAVYGVLLAEQQVRQGRWQDGTESMMRALQVPDDGRGIVALQNMIAALIDAIIAGRLPEVDGMKFINRLDYSLPTKSSSLTALFGSARRSIHARQPMERAQQPIVLPQAGRSQSQSPSPQQYQQQSPQPKPVQQQPVQHQQQPAQQRQQAQVQNQQRSQPQQVQQQYQVQQQPRQSTQSPKTQKSTSSTKSKSAPAQSSSRARLAERNRERADRLESRPQGDPNSMVMQMHEERMLNQEIQNMVPDAVPPEWPSLVENPIDQIPPIGMDSRNILGGVTGLTAADFRLTGGDITIEIILERCLHSLMNATQSDKANTLLFRPTSIARLELNMRDGLLDQIERLDSLYIDETKIENDLTLALGRFLGDCVVQTYGGTWSYERPPEASVIHLGKGATLRPFELAQQWLDADDIDDVHLDSITRNAKLAMADYAMLSTVVAYADPTPGLEGAALTIKLAELWIDYRFSMRDADLQPVADAIDVIENDPNTILFSINSKWAPESARGINDRAVNSDGNIFMAYIRSTGEFLLMGSRKHFGRYVSLRWDSLNADTVAEVAAILATAHLPAAKMVNDEALAKKINAHMGTNEISAPRFASQNHSATLVAWFYKDNSAFKYQLTRNDNELVPYKLQILQILNK